jgi:hypothetical protein
MEIIKQTIEDQIAQLVELQYIPECRKLNTDIKKKCKKDINQFKLEEKYLPMHFSGNSDSEIVMV